MFSELFNGEIVYSKRFPLPDELNELAEAAAKKRPAVDESAVGESFAEFARQSDEKCMYILRPDKVKFCQQFIDYAKSFSEKFEIGIDVVNNSFSYVIKLYIDLALFSGREKEMLGCMVIAADEVSFDRPAEDDCEMTVSLRCYTHDLYHNGRRRKLY